MGRSVVADESVQSHIGTFFGKEKWLIGLIIGQLTHQKDYAVHVIRSPKPDPSDAAAVDEDASPHKPSSEPPDRLANVDEHYIATHAKQVQRMLPGGLKVIGIFALAPPDMMNDAQVKLRQVLYSIHKSLTKGLASFIPSQEGEITDRILLQICSLSRKLTCRTFDAADPKCSARPADWKYQQFAASWPCIESSVGIDITIPVSRKNSSLSLMKQIQSGVRPLCENIWNSLATVDGQLVQGSSPLDASQPSRRKRGKGEEQEAAQKFSANLYIHCKSQGVSDPVLTDCTAKLHLRGRMLCRAYVHSKATTEEATQALKTDVIRSLLSRCELMYEEIMQTEEGQDARVLYETPRRVFGQLPGTSLSLCDYVFPDEAVSDCLERLQELADLHLDEESLEADLEPLPSEEDLQKPPQTLEEETATPENPEEQHSTSVGVLGMVVGGAVAALAAALSYMFLGQE